MKRQIGWIKQKAAMKKRRFKLGTSLEKVTPGSDIGTLRHLPGSKPKWRRGAGPRQLGRGCRAWDTIWTRRSWGIAAWSPNSPPVPRDPQVVSGRCTSTQPSDSSSPSPRKPPFHAYDSFDFFLKFIISLFSWLFSDTFDFFFWHLTFSWCFDFFSNF